MKAFMFLFALLICLCADLCGASPACLTLGSQGPEVRRIQVITGATPVDGIYGEITEAYVKAFQRDRGLIPDGIWGPRTQAIANKQKPVRVTKSEVRTMEVRKALPHRRTVKSHRQLKVKGATSTLASVFGLTVKGKRDRLDNGIGSGYLSPVPGRGINTRNKSVVGVALPVHVICKTFNVPPPPKRCHYRSSVQWWKAVKRTWAAWEPVRQARVSIFCPATGKCLVEGVKIVDLGPGYGPLQKGVGIDFTYRLNKMIGGDGMTPVAYRIDERPRERTELASHFASL